MVKQLTNHPSQNSQKILCLFEALLVEPKNNFYRTQVYLGSDLWVLISLSHSIQDYFADLADVTLADEDSNSIPTDDVNRAILGNLAMQVAPSGGQH